MDISKCYKSGLVIFPESQFINTALGQPNRGSNSAFTEPSFPH